MNKKGENKVSKKSSGTPLIESNILNNGFTKSANLYTRNGDTLQLIKGHTWQFTPKGIKYGYDVRTIEDIAKYENK